MKFRERRKLSSTWRQQLKRKRSKIHNKSMFYLCYLLPNIWSCLWFLRSSEDLDKFGCIQSAFVFSAYCDIKWFAPDYTLCEKKNTQNRQNSDLWPMTRCPQRWNNKLHWTKEQCIKGAFPHMYALMGHASEFDEKFWTYQF